MAIVLKLLTLYSQWNFAKGRIKNKYTANGERENGLHKQLPGEVFRAIPAQGDFISEVWQKGHALHTMTKAEVIIVIDHKGQRFVGGSLGILETY